NHVCPAPRGLKKRADFTCHSTSCVRSVTTNRQTEHAETPAWLNQRQVALIEHFGSDSVALMGSKRITVSITPHRFPVHCVHLASTHRLLNRNRFSGERPSEAILTNSFSIATRPGRYAVVPSS